MEKTNYQDYPLSNDHWGRKQTFDEYNAPRIARCASMTNAIKLLELSGAKNYTPKEVFTMAYRILGFIETGDIQGEKLDQFVQNKMKESFAEKKQPEVDPLMKAELKKPSPYQISQGKNLKR